MVGTVLVKGGTSAVYFTIISMILALLPKYHSYSSFHYCLGLEGT